MALNKVFNSTLIIGNGFDKNCGLKTGYKDVYDLYVKTPSSDSVISEFKKNIGDSYENWSDFELGMASYAKTLESEEQFIECLYDFNSFMHQYLKGIESGFVNSWNNLAYRNDVEIEFAQSFETMGRGVTHNLDNLLNTLGIPDIESLGIITFNYTEIFDKLLQYRFSGFVHNNPIHVHGILGDDPILGVDRENQLDVKFEITDRVRRSFIKPIFNQEYDAERVRDARKLIEMSRVVFVFGASLGKSDLSWRELLGEWLTKDKEHHLIIYDYENSKQIFLTASERLNYEFEQKRILLNSWSIENEGDILNQLHLPCNNIFNIKTAMDAGMQKQLMNKTIAAN